MFFSSKLVLQKFKLIFLPLAGYLTVKHFDFKFTKDQINYVQKKVPNKLGL